LEAFEYTGIWYVPEEADKQVTGILKFDPKSGTQLEIIGSYEMSIVHVLDFAKIIHGVLVNGRKVTLWNCYVTKRSGGMSSYEHTFILVEVVLIGFHFKRVEDIAFHTFSISYLGLEDWIDNNSFDLDIQNWPLECTIKYKRPTELIATLDAFTVSIRYFAGFSKNTRQAVLKQAVYLVVSSETPIHFNELTSNLFFHIRNFFALGVAHPIYPQLVTGNTAQTEENISIFYRTDQHVELTNTFHPNYSLFLLKDISVNFQNHLQTWFSKSSKLEPVCELYFGVFYSPAMYLRVQFLLLAQALEAYHQRLYGGTYMSAKDYKEVRKILSAKIPPSLQEEHKASLQSRIDFGNELTLFTRLRLILEVVLKPYKSQLDPLIEDSEKLAQKIKDTRNYFTHYSKSSKKKAILDDDELYSYVQKMKFILQICLLKELEFPEEKIRTLITQHMPYHMLIVYLHNKRMRQNAPSP
jgi:hypothetical protein